MEKKKTEVPFCTEDIKMETAPVEKKNSRPPFGSHEYSFWRLVLFILVGFVGGSLIGGLLAYPVTVLLPCFREGGALYFASATFITLFTYVIVFFWLLIMLKPILNTDLKTMITGGRPLKIRLGLLTVAVFLVGFFIALCITGLNNLTFSGASAFQILITVLVSLIIVPLQTTAEEITFRLSIGRFAFRNRIMTDVRKMILLSVISGLLFFVPHLMNPEVAEYGWFVAVCSYFLSGFTLMMTACLTGSFEMCLAYHAINNIAVGMLVSGEVSAISMAPLFIDHSNDPVRSAIGSLVMYAMVIGLAVWYRKKYVLPELEQETAA